MTIVIAWLATVGLGWAFSTADLVDAFVDMELLDTKFTKKSSEFRGARSNMFRQLAISIALGMMVLIGVASAFDALNQSLFTFAMFVIAIVLTVESIRARIFRKRLIRDADLSSPDDD